MNTLDAGPVLLTCGDQPTTVVARSPPFLPWSSRSCPGRAELDPVLRELAARRLVVAGTDADLAAVLVRLLRRERLDVEVAYLPRGRSAAARAWGLPRDAAALALDGVAAPVPLVRDDAGGVLVGRGRGAAAGRGVLRRDAGVARGRARRRRGRAATGSRCGRAARAGRPTGARAPCRPARPPGAAPPSAGPCSSAGEPFTPVLDGVPHPRAVTRWAWYRHTADWLLVRPDP